MCTSRAQQSYRTSQNNRKTKKHHWQIKDKIMEKFKGSLGFKVASLKKKKQNEKKMERVLCNCKTYKVRWHAVDEQCPSQLARHLNCHCGSGWHTGGVGVPVKKSSDWLRGASEPSSPLDQAEGAVWNPPPSLRPSTSSSCLWFLLSLTLLHCVAFGAKPKSVPRGCKKAPNSEEKATWDQKMKTVLNY